VQSAACTGLCLSEYIHGRKDASPRKVFEKAGTDERGDGERQKRNPTFQRQGALFGFNHFLI
jgi:hypothetical protein